MFVFCLFVIISGHLVNNPLVMQITHALCNLLCDDDHLNQFDQTLALIMWNLSHCHHSHPPLQIWSSINYCCASSAWGWQWGWRGWQEVKIIASKIIFPRKVQHLSDRQQYHFRSPSCPWQRGQSVQEQPRSRPTPWTQWRQTHETCKLLVNAIAPGNVNTFRASTFYISSPASHGVHLQVDVLNVAKGSKVLFDVGVLGLLGWKKSKTSSTDLFRHGRLE